MIDAAPAIRVLAVDNDPMVIDSIRMMFKHTPDIDVVATANDGDEVVEAVIKHHPDVVLMDVDMPRMNGIEATQALSARPNPPQVVMLTTHLDSNLLERAIHAGALGYVMKTVAREVLQAAVRNAAAGHSPFSAQSATHLRAGFLAGSNPQRQAARNLVAGLTERERRIGELVAREMTNEQIARALHVSESTVKSHLSSIQTKLGVQSRVGIATTVIQAG